MFTVTDAVANSSGETVTLYPYGLVSRHGMPHVQGFYILHEGLIGVVDGSLEEIGYKKALENPATQIKATSGWLGITDKYWAAAVVPAQGKTFEARFGGTPGAPGAERFQTDYLMGAVSVPPAATPRPRAMSLPAPRKSISSTATPRNTRSPNSTS